MVRNIAWRRLSLMRMMRTDLLQIGRLRRSSQTRMTTAVAGQRPRLFVQRRAQCRARLINESMLAGVELEIGQSLIDCAQ